MSAYLSPIGNEVQTDTNGAPLVGGKIYTYLAGTTTAAATYTSSAGSVQQANPIILNAQGLAASPVWLGAGVAMKLVVKDSSDVTIRTIDNVLGVNDPIGVTAQDQWVAYSGVPSYISATSFSVAGDATSTLEVGRRIRTTNSGGIVYSTISGSSFGAGITTVTVLNDSGTLDSGLSAVSYGILSRASTSIPYLSGMIVNRAYAEYTTNADLTTVIPYDDTLPQNTEGTQIISVSITPRSATNRLRFHFQGQVQSATSPRNAIAALFQTGTASALRASAVATSAADFPAQIALVHEQAAGSTSALTFTIRVGPQTGTIRMNGTSSARIFGGASAATLIVDEIAA